MVEDREVLREVWEGRIPTAFNLASEDVSTAISPETYYVMLPRMSYFALATDKVKKYFSKFVSDDSINGDVWFSFHGNPVKLHLPIGLIYDQMKVEATNSEALGPPWKLNVHFGDFPEETILKCFSRDDVESQFMSCVKEADQFKHGGKIMSTMQKKEHNQLWLGLANDKFDQFWAVNRRLMDVSSSQRENRSASPSTSLSEAKSSIDEASVTHFKTFKHIPVRMYKADSLLALRLVKPTKTCDNGQERLSTLQDMLEDYFPDQEVKQVRAMTQGIEPDIDTPLQWMAEHLSYPDNFLHITVKNVF